MDSYGADLSRLQISELIEKETSIEEDNNDKKRIIEEIIARKPVFTEYVEKLVNMHTKDGYPDKAREVFKSSLKANDANIEIWRLH